ncbi:MAG: DUF4058 family protein [Chloroflexi bacterium]|nr:DUF4058 family protein [Chloroflexota bacterium]
MAIQSNQNLYPGINAHLNSALQNRRGAWRPFHSSHITDLTRTIDSILPAGYLAISEQSLQISELIPPIGPRLRNKEVIPDVTVFQTRSSTQPEGAALAMAATPPSRTVSIEEWLTAEDFLQGVMIYQTIEGDLPGRPVTRIELLSPANKPGGSHNAHYTAKRSETLRSGLRLVEIDYLHQTPPIMLNLPSYADGDEGAFPYSVLVSDPRPTFEQGKTDVYEFGVDDTLPIIPVPLAGEDVVLLNLGEVYNRTFASSRFFQMVVDYEQEPPHFDRYTPADQARIRDRLAAIVQSQGLSP